MRFLTYADSNEPTVGILDGDTVNSLPAQLGPYSMLEFIQGGPELWAETRQVYEREGGIKVPLSSAKLLPPISNPSKVVAIGLNYMDHCREQGVEPPKQPLIFAKFPSSIIGPGDYITWSTDETNQVDYEVELGVVIGRRARYVPLESALDYVFGYTVLNDV